MNVRFTSTFACLLTLATSLTVFCLRQPALEVTISADTTEANSHSVPASSPTSPVTSAGLAVRPLPSESLQGILPELTESVADWRAFRPESLVIELDGGLRVPFQVTKIEADDRRTVMTAHLARSNDGQHPLDGAFMVATAVSADRWDAVVILPGMEYRVTVRGGHAEVEQSADFVMACGADTAPQYQSSETVTVAATSTTTFQGAVTVDVLFLYNSEALAERKYDRLAIDADCANYIAACNAVLLNSKIDVFAWRYLGAEPAPAYKTSESHLDDLRAMRGAGEIAAFVEGIQRDRGADQVVMLAGGRKTDAVGWAWVGGSTAHSVVSYPYITYGDGTRATTIASYMTVCHELAHNFGCNHQREDPSAQAVDGDGKYHYGHVADGKFGPTGSICAVYLNSANMTRVPYFSTAEVSYEGRPLGVGLNQPRAAMNAQIIRENAARIAGLQAAPAGPVIVEHPQSATVAAGENVFLSVKASGDGLSYRWFRNGSALSGVSSDRLVLSNVGSEQAGSYHVEVSNPVGTATSFTATLSVNGASAPGSSVTPAATGSTNAPATSTPSAGTSGGGSGGGSTGGLPALALLVLLVARRAARTKRA